MIKGVRLVARQPEDKKDFCDDALHRATGDLRMVRQNPDLKLNWSIDCFSMLLQIKNVFRLYIIYHIKPSMAILIVVFIN